MGVLLWSFSGGDAFDFAIYRGALTDVLHGGSAYDFMVPHKGVSMGFIYPPFASLVMLPLAMVPVAVGKSVLAVLTAALVMAALVGCIRAIDARRRRIGRRELSLFACALGSLTMALSESAVTNMSLGQVSFAICALVLLDVTLLPARWRGTLVGLVGAIKLAPMILVPYYLVTRQWRAALNATIAFAAATIVGGVFRWSDSIRYWCHPDVVRASLGDPARTDNWSIYGVLSRLGLGDSARTVSWLALAAVVLGLAVWRATRHAKQGHELEATLVMGLAAGLVTVATWPHHLMFGLVACALLAVQRPLIGLPLLISFSILGYWIPDSMGNWAVLLMTALIVFLPGTPRAVTAPTLMTEPAPELVPDP